MTHKVYIRPEVGDPDSPGSWPVQCLIADSQGNTGKVRQGTFAELKNEMAGEELVLVLPADQVLLTSVHLPGKNISKIKQALPFALEDQLLADIDDQYFVLGPKLELEQGEQSYAVAIIEQTYLHTILDSLRNIDLYPTKVLPESLLLPLHDGEITVVEDGERVIVRTGKYGGFACDKSNLEVMLNSVVTENTNKIALYGANDVLPGWLGKHQYQQYELSHQLISLLYHDDVTGIDLLPANYVRRERMNTRLKQWLPAAAMVLTWAVIQLSIQAYTYIGLKKQDIVLQQSLEKIYRQTFPDARKIVNVEAQMRQRLEDLRKRSGKAESGFTEMIVKSAPVLRKAPGLIVNALRYHDGRMDLELEVRDLDSLEQLKENLIKTGNWQVEIQSASSTENKVQGKLQVRSSKS